MGVKVKEKIKGSGVWWLFINHNGRRKSKRIGSEAAAKEAAKKIEAKLVLKGFGILEDRAKPTATISYYCGLWLEDYVKQTKRATTYQRYKSLWNTHIKAIIGNAVIDEIKRSDIRNTLLAIDKKGLAKSSIAGCRNVLSGIFEYAIDEEVVRHNPVRGILRKLGLDEHGNRTPVEPMTAKEVEAFLDACAKYQKRWYPFFLAAFRTGARLGELLALHWGDIDWQGRYILVQRSFRQGRVTSTKTSKARRVDMSEQLTWELERLYSQRKREGLSAGKGKPEEIIFHTKGGYTSQNSIRNVWLRVLGKAGFRHRRFHDIRHTFASLLLSNGESPVYVKEQLGHSSIQMTVDVYGHLIPSGNRKAVDRLDAKTPTIANSGNGCI